ncbi:MAG: SET domain-containing protein-lysine N-methyltransferase [Plesiomonas sp.]|uniref:SET domain-containing protein-lysine N-methyltransferase n=1 Tax=Plesiomonas sp. TaxID=2486279 RepID=UPI003F35B6C3
MHCFSHSIDASNEDGSLGRLVNDDHINPNCKVKTVVFEEKPHLCLFSVRDIFPDEEITYNYGDSSWPWRSMVSLQVLSSSRLYPL